MTAFISDYHRAYGAGPICKVLPMGPIGNIPPAEAKERYYARLDEPPMAA